MKMLTLSIVTPAGSNPPVSCDSVRLTLADNAAGEGGGSCGIRPGHVRALLSLAEGPLTASLNGTPVLTATCGKGFATVEKDVVTLVVESIQKDCE